MHPRFPLLSALLFGVAFSARAVDVTVVFNEVMYHPATNEAAFEWVELRNQMAVDMDLSGWKLARSVDFTFAEGTVIPGGGHLVVALSPTNITAVYGITNVVGPFAGRLGNSGDTIELRNNNNRLMDEVGYGVKGDWPVAPDGAGPSLSKMDEESASDNAERWRASVQMGGSPGVVNFPPGTNSETRVLNFDAAWKYTAVAPTGDWRAVNFDAGAWLAGTGAFAGGTAGWRPSEVQAIATVFNTGVGSSGELLAYGQPDPHYVLTESAYSTNPPPPAIPATVTVNNGAWTLSDSFSRWIGAISNGNFNVAAGVYRFQTVFDLSAYDASNVALSVQVAADNNVTNVALNSVSNGFNFTGFTAFSPVLTLTNGFLAGLNTLDFVTINGGASSNPGAFRAKVSGTSTKYVPTNTPIADPATTHYFRTTFVVTGDVTGAALKLRAIVDDGAVFNLNGSELLRLNLPGGTVSNGTLAVSNIGNAGFSGPFLLPGTLLVPGTNVLAVELHPAAGGTNDAMFGAELTVIFSNSPLPKIPKLAFNEMPDVTNATFWVEILNYGNTTVAMTNWVFKRFGLPDQEYVIPATNLAPDAFLVIVREQLGWGADPGDQLVLYTPGKSNVVDAMVAKRYDRARWPDGTGKFMHPAALTQGATNAFVFTRDVVINEIMYHPRDPQGAATNSPEQWIEIFNRGTSTVDLTGWRIEEDAGQLFDFPAGKTIAPGGYLVVARDAAWLAAKFPTSDIIGNFSNRLSKSGSLIELFDGTHYPIFAWGNVADAVYYRDSRPWPEFADGLGSSIELRNPFADNARPESWAASDDSPLSSWQTITYSGTATVETASSPTTWKEFICGLLDAGEVLLDDISVIESPTGSARQVIQNGNFEDGSSWWRIIGNHKDSEVIVDPDNGANHVLRLRASGYAEHMHNHAETTLTNNLPITNGLVYQVSFKAKWIAGCNRLTTRLYFNRLARLHELATPTNNGTPGAQNSRYVSNIGPTFSGLAHTPVVPSNAQAVAVSVTAADPDGLSAATLFYSTTTGVWQSSAMASTPNADGSTRFIGGIPGQPLGTIVQFYVAASDGVGAQTFYPPGGSNSRALYMVAANGLVTQRVKVVRLVMTAADITWLHANTNVMNNGGIPCTVVLDERAATYDAMVHLQGSERGRNVSSRVGMTIRFPSDQRYRGTLDGFTVDRSGGYSGKGGDNDEILLKHLVNRAGLLPGMYDDLCQFYAPRSSDDGSGLMVLAKYGGEFLDGQYKNGSDGELFKLELIYYPTTTIVTNDPQSAKKPQPDGVVATDLKDLGNDAESYRWVNLKENHTARNNYAPMIALAKAFSTTGTTLDAQMGALMDVDEWMREVAFLSLVGNSDIYPYSLHNQIIYFRPEDGKAMGFLWDLDYAFTQATNASFPGTGSANTTKLINRPANLHAFYEHVYDLAKFTGDSAYNARWASNYAVRVGQNWNNAVIWLTQRAGHIMNVLSINAPLVITNNAGLGFETTNSFTTLYGTAPITIRTITINGIAYPITWLTSTNWSLTIPLTGYENNFVLQSYDLRGNLLTNATDSITVTNTGVPAPKPVVVNEWMADNTGPGGYPDSADALFQDWIELFNPNTNTAVNLTGFYLTDNLAQPTKFYVPSNTVIAPLGFLLVWADDESLQNIPGTNTELHAAFKLSAGGEAIGLYNASTVLQSSVTFSQQLQNVSQGFYPDGTTNRYSMTNWTPRAANLIGPLITPNLAQIASAETTINLVHIAVPGHLYTHEYTDDLTTNAWQNLGSNRATATLLSLTNTTPSAPQRMFRALLIP